MLKLLVTLSVLLASLGYISCKCDMLKEFKPEFDQLSGWAKSRCDKNPSLSQADMDKAKGCYNKCLKPSMTSKDAQVVDGFLAKRVFVKETLDVCSNKATQDRVKNQGMSEVGVSRGMKLKKEVESDCPKFKGAFQSFSSCVKA
ncbi:uncharacterized protein LOC128956775 [Oppia nitens]|uniref:uncharacterized protein LOC128956775 n=1 Tax=Oppia nitens TaxID=1686743 RepID=UPI0023DBE9BB|nr:uncharacterized protein LOC128956775 [Oppia nitens]